MKYILVKGDLGYPFEESVKIQKINSSDTDIELLHIIDTSDIKDTEDPGKATICKDERKYYTRIRC